MHTRTISKTLLVAVILLIAATFSSADTASYTGVTDLILNIAIPGGMSIDDMVVTIDSNDAALAAGTQNYELTHDLTATNLVLTTATNNNYTLEDLGAGIAASGVHIQLSLAAGVFTLTISKNAEGLGVDTFAVTRTWTFSILGFDTPHNVDVTTAAENAFGVAVTAFPEIEVTQGAIPIPSETGTHAFGNVTADGDGGLTSGSTVFTIENTGSANLDLGTITITGSDAVDFDLDTAGTLTSVPSSTSTTFSVQFDPLTVGAKTAVVTVPNNDTLESIYTFEITGTGDAVPVVDIDIHQGATPVGDGTYNHAFGNVIADGNGTIMSAPVPFTIENTGGGTLNVAAISVSTTDFDLTLPALPAAITTGSETFSVTFDPLTSGAKNATVTVSSDDPDAEGTYTFTVSGTGSVVPTPEIDLFQGVDAITDSTGSFSFGNILADGDGVISVAPVTFTIENNGTGPLSVSSVTLTDGNIADFDIDTSTLAATVAAPGSTSFTVAFDPLTPGDKAATVTIENNDSDEDPYTFAVTGNALPMDTIFFPPAYNLPFENEPVIDGVVDSHPTDPTQNEMGWNNAYRLRYENGTTPQMAFQALRENSSTPDYLMMSFEARNDFTFDDEDLIILTFRPNQDLLADQGDDLRIFIFPLYAGIGAKDPAAVDLTIEDDPNIAKPGRPVREVRYYQKQLQPDTSWDWIEIADVDTGDFDFSVYSYPDGTNYAWDVEMKIPTSVTRSGSPWISLDDDFLFFYDLVRVNTSLSPTSPDYATQYTWPRNLPEQPYGDLETTYEFPFIFWGDASITNSGQVKGVSIDRSGIGVLNDPCLTTGISATDISRDFTIGEFNGAGELTSRSINRIVATVTNTSEKVVSSGGPATLQQVPAEDIRVRFRLAHWGATLGADGDWIVVEGLEEGAVADPPFPPTPTCVPPFTFHTSKNSLGWLPSKQIPAASGSPLVPGHEYFFYDFILTGDETTGDVQYYRDIQDHQCIYVEVDSLSDTDIITRSTWQNMNFVEASRYRDSARISTRGAGLPPEGRSQHSVILQTRMKTWIYEERERDQKSARSATMVSDNWTSVPNPLQKPPAIVDSYLEYTVDAYYDTGESIIINDRTFALHDPIGSFGYVAHHDGPVEEWQGVLESTEMVGLTEIADGIYNVSIDPESHVNIDTEIESIEPTKYAVSFHGGISLPQPGFYLNHDYGISGGLDLEVRLLPWISGAFFAGYHYFLDDVLSPESLVTVAASLRIRQTLGPVVSVYAGGGVDLLFLPSGRESDYFAEAAVAYRLKRSLSIEAGVRAHGLLDPQYRFLTIDLGLITHF